MTRKLLPEPDEKMIRRRHRDPDQVPWVMTATQRFIYLWAGLNETATGIAMILSPADRMGHSTPLDWGSGKQGEVPYWSILKLEAEAIKRGVDLDGWEFTAPARAREAGARADEMLRSIAHLDQVLPTEIEGLREEMRSLSAQLAALHRQTAPEPIAAAATDPEEAMTDPLAGLEDRLPADMPKHQELPGPPTPAKKARTRKTRIDPDRTA